MTRTHFELSALSTWQEIHILHYSTTYIEIKRYKKLKNVLIQEKITVTSKEYLHTLVLLLHCTFKLIVHLFQNIT